MMKAIIKTGEQRSKGKKINIHLLIQKDDWAERDRLLKKQTGRKSSGIGHLANIWVRSGQVTWNRESRYPGLETVE